MSVVAAFSISPLGGSPVSEDGSVSDVVADVVRTRMFITDVGDADAVGRAHGRLFSGMPPAATMVVVAGLLDPRWKVEIEAEAVLGRPPGPA